MDAESVDTTPSDEGAERSDRLSRRATSATTVRKLTLGLGRSCSLHGGIVKKRPAVAWTGRIVLLAALAILLTGCFAPSTVVVAPFAFLFLGLAALAGRIADFIRALLQLSFSDIYQVISKSVSRAVAAVRNQVSNLHWVDLFRLIGEGIQRLAGFVVTAIFFTVSFIIIYVFAQFLFIALELPYNIYFGVRRLRSHLSSDNPREMAEARAWLLIVPLTFGWAAFTVSAFALPDFPLQPATAIFGCLGILVLVATLRSYIQERRRGWHRR